MNVQKNLLQPLLQPVNGHLPDPAYAAQLKPAAVLALFHTEADEDWLLFTRRTEHLRQHKGQISFPGGKFDLEDQTLDITALRETEEEMGIAPEAVSLWGSLEAMPTIHNYLITPFVGSFSWPYPLKPNPGEIAEVIRVPVAHLLNHEHYRTETREFEGHSYLIHYFDYLPHTIWGITGQLLHQLLDLIRQSHVLCQ